MGTATASHARSKARPRPKPAPKTALEPRRVVTAALEVLDREGLDGLTVRSIAERLGVQNPALYWHFRSKQEIVDRMAQEMLADAVVPRPDGDDWQAWLVAVARAFRRVMLAHRDGARVLASADLSQSPMISNVETGLTLLTGLGFDARDALVGIAAALDYTLGATFEEQADPVRRGSSTPHQDPGGDAGPGSARARKAIAPNGASTRAPALAAAFAEATATLDGDAMFEGGLRLLIAGLATRQAAPRRTARRGVRKGPAVTSGRAGAAR